MFKSIKHAAIAAALAAGTLSAATTAEAHDRYDRQGDDTAAWAIGAGIIGLAIGAAIASDDDDRYYRGRYYNSYPRGYYYDGYPRSYRYDRDRRNWRDNRRWNGNDRRWRDNDRRWRDNDRRWNRGERRRWRD